ncbi:hypothetical protein GOBAR_AA31798 [Gossypium barbadense]|uniref:Uncharacterized protein n=1 Tax=Gossypium barbadense TaxID=3634 RepID=A0A2P5WCS7_GOSBA|nr:hypothetical protein GOBAR_AA31798 [Gossypium barbadense]
MVVIRFHAKSRSTMGDGSMLAVWNSAFRKGYADNFRDVRNRGLLTPLSSLFDFLDEFSMVLGSTLRGP